MDERRAPPPTPRIRAGRRPPHLAAHRDPRGAGGPRRARAGRARPPQYPARRARVGAALVGGASPARGRACCRPGPPRADYPHPPPRRRRCPQCGAGGRHDHHECAGFRHRRQRQHTPTPTAKPPGTPAATGAVNGSAVATPRQAAARACPSTTVTGSATRTGTNAPGTATGTTSGTAAAGTPTPTARATATATGAPNRHDPGHDASCRSEWPLNPAAPSVSAGTAPTTDATPDRNCHPRPEPRHRPARRLAHQSAPSLTPRSTGRDRRKSDPAKGPKDEAVAAMRPSREGAGAEQASPTPQKGRQPTAIGRHRKGAGHD